MFTSDRELASGYQRGTRIPPRRWVVCACTHDDEYMSVLKETVARKRYRGLGFHGH